MNTGDATVQAQVDGIGAFDAIKLKKLLPEGSLGTEPADGTPDVYGDLGASLVVLGLAGLGALAVWVAKNRKRTKVGVHRTIRRADGSSDEYQYNYDGSESLSDAEVVRELTKGSGMTSAEIDALVAQVGGTPAA